MIDTDGAAPVVAPDAGTEALDAEGPQTPPPDWSRPQLFTPVVIELDRPRRMRLSFKALRLFESKTGISPWDHDRVWRPSGSSTEVLKVTLTLLWCSLLEDDPTLKMDQLEDLPGMEIGNIHYIRNRLEACWGESMPPAEEPKVANGTAPKASRPRG